MQNLLLQFMLCRIVRVSPVLALVKVFVDVVCLQHRLFALERQALLPVIRGLFLGITFLFRDRWTWPIRSRRFLFRRYAITGLFWNVFASSRLVCRMGQWRLIILLISGWSVL